jgi:hypothetical protein
MTIHRPSTRPPITGKMMATIMSMKKEMNVQQVKVMILMIILIICETIHGMSNVLLECLVPSISIKEKQRWTMDMTIMMDGTTVWFLFNQSRLVLIAWVT